MSCEDDQSIYAQQQLLDLRIAAIAKAAPVDFEHNPIGKCWWCLEPIGHSRRFCDAECASDYERYS